MSGTSPTVNVLTYAIRGEDNSGIISVNGGAAHQADVGDLVIIATFGDFTEAEANAHKPRLVYANPDNTRESHCKLYSQCKWLKN
jgi:aspartate 1-decarboxylase